MPRQKRVIEQPENPMHRLQEPLLDVEAVRTLLQVGRNTVFKLIHREGLPVHWFGRYIRVDRDELAAWLAQRQRNHLSV